MTLPRNHIDRIDKDDCAVYAVSFTCNVTPEEARRCLEWQGRRFGDGTYQVQISRAVRTLRHKMRRVEHPAKTVQGFARAKLQGAYMVMTCDHVLAVIDGRICDKPENTNLARIEKIYKILVDSAP